MTSLTVVCVENGNYQGCGERYVDTLRAMVARHLSQPYEFVVHRDNERPGWWAKTALFRSGRFTGRILYLDLDSVITGPLDKLVEHKGIIHLTDWGWKTPTYGSGVMVWDAGEHSDVDTLYTPDVPARFVGDQDWITALGGWAALPAAMCCSYRYHCKVAPPAGCVVCSMHGRPKPHEITSGWVPEYWRT